MGLRVVEGILRRRCCELLHRHRKVGGHSLVAVECVLGLIVEDVGRWVEDLSIRIEEHSGWVEQRGMSCCVAELIDSLHKLRPGSMPGSHVTATIRCFSQLVVVVRLAIRPAIVGLSF